jgi:hypothetical protein
LVFSGSGFGGAGNELLLLEFDRGASNEPKVVRICTAEDLVVMKAFANRVIDWHDVRGVIVRQGSAKMDWRYIQEELAPLCEAKEEPEILDRLISLKRELEA